MKKKKRIIIIVCAVALAVIVLPYALIYGFFALVALDMNKPPDHSGDTLIPSGYVQTDGNRGYGAGDFEDYCYYVYEEKPKLDNQFSTVKDDENKKQLIRLIDRYNDELTAYVTNGDEYYIAEVYDRTRRFGGLLYFYDNEKNTLYRIDYCW